MNLHPSTSDRDEPPRILIYGDETNENSVQASGGGTPTFAPHACVERLYLFTLAISELVISV